MAPDMPYKWSFSDDIRDAPFNTLKGHSFVASMFMMMLSDFPSDEGFEGGKALIDYTGRTGEGGGGG